ncbi:MAG: hypothetical protein ABI767_15305 [Rhodanobacter sp.]
MNAEQNELEPDDLRALALQMAAFTQLLEQRGQQVVQQTQEAAQHLSQTAKGAAASSERMTAAAIEQFRQAAAGAVADGLQRPMEEAGRIMQSGTQNIEIATNELENRVHTVGKALAASAWKAFVVSALASFAVIGVAVYMGVRTHRDMARAEWVGLINTSIANGKLAPCHDEGLCAHISKKWVRIDQ